MKELDYGDTFGLTEEDVVFNRLIYFAHPSPLRVPLSQ
jgi:hypothetical protein